MFGHTGEDASPTITSSAGSESPPTKRSVTLLLGLGITFFPYVFAWWTLKNGYSRVAKVISFSWLAMIVVLVVTSPPQDSTGLKMEETSTSIANSPTSKPVARVDQKVEQEQEKVKPAVSAESAEQKALTDLRTEANNYHFVGVYGHGNEHNWQEEMHEIRDRYPDGGFNLCLICKKENEKGGFSRHGHARVYEADGSRSEKQSGYECRF